MRMSKEVDDFLVYVIVVLFIIIIFIAACFALYCLVAFLAWICNDPFNIVI